MKNFGKLSLILLFLTGCKISNNNLDKVIVVISAVDGPIDNCSSIHEYNADIGDCTSGLKYLGGVRIEKPDGSFIYRIP